MFEKAFSAKNDSQLSLKINYQLCLVATGWWRRPGLSDPLQSVLDSRKNVTSNESRDTSFSPAVKAACKMRKISTLMSKAYILKCNGYLFSKFTFPKQQLHMCANNLGLDGHCITKLVS